MEEDKTIKFAKLQRDALNVSGFIQIFVFTTHHHLNRSFIIIHTYEIRSFDVETRRHGEIIKADLTYRKFQVFLIPHFLRL